MAYDDIVLGQSTSNRIIEVTMRDSTTGMGKTGLAYGDVAAYYVREGGTATTIGTLVSGSPGDSYSSLKWAEVDATNMPGVYQFHVPNTLLASGVNAVTIVFKASGAIDKSVRILISQNNLRAAALTANAYQLGGTIQTGVDLGAKIVGTLASGTHNPQSGDAYAIVNNGTYGNSAIKSALGTAQTGDAYAVVSNGTYGLSALKTLIDTITGYVDCLPASWVTVLDAAGVRAALGLASANVDTQLSTINAKTTNLPASPAAVGSAMTLADDSIKAATFDESTAFPLKSADTGSTQVARTGADSDTLETLSDQIDAVTAPTLGDIVDGVLDEALSSHTTPGSVAAGISAASSAGDPWATLLPGAYGAGTAGELIGNMPDTLTDLQGSGFSSSTDSMHAVRAKYDADISPLVTAGVSSGSESSHRMLDRIIRAIRTATDEPSLDPKYTDAHLVEMVEDSFQSELADINLIASNPILCRMTLTIQSSVREYLLPPVIQMVMGIVQRDADSGLPLVQWRPRHKTDWTGAGFTFEGRVLRLDPEWRRGDFDVELLFIPNGDFRLHYGSGVAASGTPDEFVLSAAPVLGALDTRDNAYVGAVIRTGVDGTGTIQERTITAYDNTTRTCTLNLDFSPALDGAIAYEIVPTYCQLIAKPVALAVAEVILASGDKARKHALVEREHVKAKRTVALNAAKFDNIVGASFESHTAMGDI